MKRGHDGDEKLEAIFGNDDVVHRRGFLYHLLLMIFAFLFGIIGTYVSLMYIYPFIQINDINIPLPVSESDSGNTIRIIEKTEEKRYIEESSIIDVVEEVSPAVVSVLSTTYYRGFFGQVFSKEGGGTGFVISADGKIITNKHVVSDDRSDYKVITKEGSSGRFCRYLLCGFFRL